MKVDCAGALVAPLELQVCSQHVGASDFGDHSEPAWHPSAETDLWRLDGLAVLQTAKVRNGHWNKKFCRKRESVSENI